MFPSERLDALLIRRGITSWRGVRTMLTRHEVLVDGNRVFDRSHPIVCGTNVVTVDGKEVLLPRDVYVMLNKGEGYECTRSEESRYESVFSLVRDVVVPPCLPGSLHCIGRLDAATTGLLLFTTNGSLSQRLCRPQSMVPKVYEAVLENEVDESSKTQYIKRAAEGLFLEREWNAPSCVASPAQLSFSGSRTCMITVTEGKYHEVRRIFRALGNSVVALERKSFGGVALDPSLPRLSWRPLSDGEVSALFDSAYH